MRCLRRNKVPFAYALFEKAEPHYDEYGNETYEQDVSYRKPIRGKANISPARNVDIVQLFGTDVNYDKVLVLDDPKLPIDENTVLWVDTPPVMNEDGTTDTPHDYIVRKVARSLNSVAIAIAKVDVRYA